MDYQSNSKKSRGDKAAPVEKNVERVVTGEVIVQKRTLGQKFKGLFANVDPKTAMGYVVATVFVPAAKNMLYDAVKSGGAHMIFGNDVARRRQLLDAGTSRIDYRNPSRSHMGGSPLSRMAPPVAPEPRGVGGRHIHENFILSTRDEAELVLERMNDIIEKFEVVSVADLNELVGLPTTHVDNKWGWIYLADVPVRQVPQGYLIDFPPAEPIQ